jgi:adenylyltransferase/sulfurtransferase
MNEDQLERYSRHILLPEIDIAGQEKLLRSRILIIGMGGLGSPAAMYLAGSGIGHMVICDDDRVELNNIQRQIIHSTEDLGLDKVDSAQNTLQALNPDITVHAINKRLHQATLYNQVRLADVVIDASDNFETRFALNEACVIENTPLISGAAIRLAGQVIVFRNDRTESPCYRCLYPSITAELNSTGACHETGVLAPVAGIIGTILAAQALKLLLNIGDTLDGHLIKFDAQSMTWRTSKLIKDPVCPVCTGPNKQQFAGI